MQRSISQGWRLVRRRSDGPSPRRKLERFKLRKLMKERCQRPMSGEEKEKKKNDREREREFLLPRSSQTSLSHLRSPETFTAGRTCEQTLICFSGPDQRCVTRYHVLAFMVTRNFLPAYPAAGDNLLLPRTSRLYKSNVHVSVSVRTGRRKKTRKRSGGR